MTPQRKDIPSSTIKTWTCSVCNKFVDNEEQEAQMNINGTIVNRTVYIPLSHYWNGYTDAVYCSVECSCFALGVKLHV